MNISSSIPQNVTAGVTGASSSNTIVERHLTNPEVSVQTKASSHTEDTKFTVEMTRKIEEEANKLFESLNTGLAIKFHEKSGEWYAVIENKLTKEVIKEVPPKYILELHAKLKEMIGVFLDEKI